MQPTILTLTHSPGVSTTICANTIHNTSHANVHERNTFRGKQGDASDATPQPHIQ